MEINSEWEWLCYFFPDMAEHQYDNSLLAEELIGNAIMRSLDEIQQVK